MRTKFSTASVIKYWKQIQGTKLLHTTTSILQILWVFWKSAHKLKKKGLNSGSFAKMRGIKKEGACKEIQNARSWQIGLNS